MDSLYLMDSLCLIITLLVIFQVKHFVSDFPLQNEYMLGKMQRQNWIKPLAAHAAVHGLSTTLIMIVFAPHYWWLGLMDFIVHFSIDRVKASPDLLNRWGPDNKFFWWALGLDQMMHHLTHYCFIIIVILNPLGF